MEDETREMTPEEIKAAEEAEKKEVERVQEARRRCGQAVAQVLQVLEPLINCGDVARVLDTVEAFYSYQPSDRLKAYLSDAFGRSAEIMPVVMDIFERCFQMGAQTHADSTPAKRAQESVAIPVDLLEVLRHMREASARAKREISQEELDKVSENLIQCEACNAAWPDPNHDKPCCPACGKPAY